MEARGSEIAMLDDAYVVALPVIDASSVQHNNCRLRRWSYIVNSIIVKTCFVFLWMGVDEREQMSHDRRCVVCANRSTLDLPILHERLV